MEAGAQYTSKLGAYPVISITLKDVKHARWEDCYSALKSVIAALYERNYFLAKSDLLSEAENIFNDICSETAEKSKFEASLKNLSIIYTAGYGKKAVILIDGMICSIQPIYKRLLREIIEFMRNLLGALKGNVSLEKSVLSGILRKKKAYFRG